MFTASYDQAKEYLARSLPWPQDGDVSLPFVNICWTFIPPDHTPEKKLPWTGRAVHSLDEAIRSIDYALRNPSTRDIYACQSTQRDAKEMTAKNGWKYFTPQRSQANAVALKSLFLDIDFKGGPNGYTTPAEAVTALGNLIKLTSLPKPSMMVSSGGGVHVYWTLDRALSVSEWEPLAFSLAEAAKQSGMKFDAGVTIDAARVLRIPDTLNHKTAVPRPVRLLATPNDFDYRVDLIAERLAPYHVHVPTRKLNGHFSGMVENPSLFTPRASILEKSELEQGIEQAKAPVPSIKELAHGCPLIKDAITTGGKEHQNPLWHLLVLASTFTQEGKPVAHLIGRNHRTYSQQETNDLFDRKQNDRAEKGIGWPTCATFSQNGSKQCGTCPHLTKNQTPFHFAFRKPAAAPLTPSSLPIPGLLGQFTNVDLPDRYKREATGLITRIETNDDGTTTDTVICNYALIFPRLQKGPWALSFTTILENGLMAQVTIETEAIGSQEMRKTLQRQGLMLHDYMVKGMTEFMVAWVEKLKTVKDAVVTTQPFGWVTRAGVLEGFSYGGYLWTVNGSQQSTIPPFEIGNQYTPIGDIEAWKEAAKLVTNQGRPALDAILACSFGAPLARFTGQPGLMMSVYSQESGLGKTTAMRIGQAVWGDPVRGMQGLTDTQNSVLNKIGMLKSLALFWDELKTSDDVLKFINLIFQLASGKEKSRLNSRVEQRVTGTWQTILVSASNESFLDYVVDKTKTTTAGIYRIFEYEVIPGVIGQIATSDASRMVARLNDNYGQVGLQYAQFLGEHSAKIDADVGSTLKELEGETKAIHDERFWTSLITCVVLGARYANHLGFTSFEENALKVFMLDTLTKMRSFRKVQPVDLRNILNVSNVFAAFLGDMRSRHTLITNKLHKGRGKPATGSIKIENDSSKLDSISVHIGKEDKLVRIRSQALSEWCAKHEVSRNLLSKALERSFGCRQTYGRMGAGTVFAGATEYVLEIDLAAQPETNFIDEA